MEPKVKKLVILLTVLSVLTLITTATFGYLYFKEKAKYTSLKSSLEKDVNDSQEEEGEVEDDGSTDEQPDSEVEENKTPLTKNIKCDEWIYADTTQGIVNMDIKYEDKEGVTFNNINSKCENMEMIYKEAKLYLTYSYGEAYPLPFKTGTEVVTLKTGTLSGTTGVKAVLGRQKYVEKITKSTQYSDGYWLNYVALESETTCTTPSEVYDTPGYPCYSGGNPFVTPAGDFSLFIPINKSTEEILEIVEFFDYVAKNSLTQTK